MRTTGALGDSEYRELLLGAGNRHQKRYWFDDDHREWTDLTTIDIDPLCQPDIIHDLDIVPWPFADDTFDEIHAIEVLEHLGSQGDYKAFFDHFGEIWRLLRPSGVLIATCPAAQSQWAWGDPSHRRIISSASLVFLSQRQYHEQIGKTAMSDFRRIWKGDFEPLWIDENDHNTVFALQAFKPARIF